MFFKLWICYNQDLPNVKPYGNSENKLSIDNCNQSQVVHESTTQPVSCYGESKSQLNGTSILHLIVDQQTDNWERSEVVKENHNAPQKVTICVFI